MFDFGFDFFKYRIKNTGNYGRPENRIKKRFDEEEKDDGDEDEKGKKGEVFKFGEVHSRSIMY